jgi:CarD family transcriptional regulator
MFSVDDYAVFPSHGVTRIASIEKKDMYGTAEDYYVLEVVDKKSKVLVPVKKAEGIGLRRIIPSSKVEAVYNILRTKRPIILGSNWKQRYKQYWDRLRTGSIVETAKVLRDLHNISLSKGLSFGERKIYETALRELSTEISIAKQIDITKAEQEIQATFN